MATQLSQEMVTTTLGFEGYRIARYLGVVRGITVRSRSALGNLAGGIQAFFGGNITVYTELCEHARAEAFELMVQHAQQLGERRDGGDYRSAGVRHGGYRREGMTILGRGRARKNVRARPRPIIRKHDPATSPAPHL